MTHGHSLLHQKFPTNPCKSLRSRLRKVLAAPGGGLYSQQSPQIEKHASIIIFSRCGSPIDRTLKVNQNSRIPHLRGNPRFFLAPNAVPHAHTDLRTLFSRALASSTPSCHHFDRWFLFRLFGFYCSFCWVFVELRDRLILSCFTAIYVLLPGWVFVVLGELEVFCKFIAA